MSLVVLCECCGIVCESYAQCGDGVPSVVMVCPVWWWCVQCGDGVPSVVMVCPVW